jgi:hypothetical protein
MHNSRSRTVYGRSLLSLSDQQQLHSTKALSNTVRQVSWLVTFLPSFPFRVNEAVDNKGKNSGMLHTVAGQLVIFTQFPINPGLAGTFAA